MPQERNYFPLQKKPSRNDRKDPKRSGPNPNIPPPIPTLSETKKNHKQKKIKKNRLGKKNQFGKKKPSRSVRSQPAPASTVRTRRLPATAVGLAKRPDTTQLLETSVLATKKMATAVDPNHYQLYGKPSLLLLLRQKLSKLIQ